MSVPEVSEADAVINALGQQIGALTAQNTILRVKLDAAEVLVTQLRSAAIAAEAPAQS